MTIIEIHPEAVKFLMSNSDIYYYEDGAHGFSINGHHYTSTNEEGKYTIQFEDIELNGNN